MCLKAIYNNISVITWSSVLLVEEIDVPVENNPCHSLLLTFFSTFKLF
jgi:hypothetical protein